MDIPFNQVTLGGNELSYVADAVAAGEIQSGGPFSERASSLLCEIHSAADVLLTTSCTDALEMTALMLDCDEGDTVIVPSYTFSSTALAFARRGYKLRFCDIERTTLGIDPESVAELLDDTVRAVVPVHYAGVGCDVSGLQAVLAARPDVAMVEDNAQGLFGSYRGQPLGTFGRFSTLSFHETKNIVCGEGGALVVNDPADVPRAHVLHQKGTNRRQFLLGQVDKYSWQDTGSSFALSDLLAAFLLGQLEAAERIQAERANVEATYHELLDEHAQRLELTLPVVPGDRVSAHHLFHVLAPTAELRDEILMGMRNEGVGVSFHYVPLHSSPAGRRFADEFRDCPVTTDISARLFRLPFHHSMTPAAIEQVATTLVRVAEKAVMRNHR